MDEAVKNLCDDCDMKDCCETPCQKVRDILWKDNRVMERRFGDCIVCYPKGKEVHFSDLDQGQLNQFSSDDVVPWTTEDFRLTQTKVFVERFFNHVSCKELAERYDVKENTVVAMYRDALKQVEKLLKVMDSRKQGIKAMRPDRFTEDQKLFLLSCVFGFTQAELSRMLNISRSIINVKVNRLAKKYGPLFEGVKDEDEKEIPIEDPPIDAKMTRDALISTVEAYTEQGLSHRQAFRRIAQRQSDVVKRPVKTRAVESRYYKTCRTLAACGA